MAWVCRICGNAANNVGLIARELMFGTREEFPYFQCSACACLQIVTVPIDMAAHYPPNYYSFTAPPPPRPPGWKKWLRTVSLRNFLEAPGGLGRLGPISSRVPQDTEAWLAASGVRQHSRILDVGCGQGRLLRQLAGWGFTSLTGVDPFVASDLSYPDGVKIWRRNLSEVDGEFDCIMMHHSFEHMNEQASVLGELRRLLAPGGRALIRIPLCSSAAFRQYGDNWVQLDAPRHFYLHSRKSFELLARAAGFGLERVIYDSTAFQFWGSEQYLQRIPLFAPESYAVSKKASVFTRAQIEAFDARALKLNAEEDGDQACFFLI